MGREERPPFTAPSPFAHENCQWARQGGNGSIVGLKTVMIFSLILESLLVSYEDIKWEIGHQLFLNYFNKFDSLPTNLISKLKRL